MPTTRRITAAKLTEGMLLDTVPTTRRITAAKLTEGMLLDTDAGPCAIERIARSKGGLFAPPPGAVVVTFTARGHEVQAVWKPGQRVQIVESV